MITLPKSFKFSDKQFHAAFLKNFQKLSFFT